jgi:hypothetical protein
MASQPRQDHLHQAVVRVGKTRGGGQLVGVFRPQFGDAARRPGDVKF